MHIINGNIVSLNSLKLFHFNKGSSKFENSIESSKLIINEQSPDLISISECNLSRTDLTSPTQFDEYDFLHDNLSLKLGYSREVLMIKKTYHILGNLT